MKHTETTPCPICHSERTQFLFEGWDLMFGYPDSSLVYGCKTCKHVFVAGMLTSEQLTDMYTNYYPRADFNINDYEPYKDKKGFLYWLDGEEGFAYRHVPERVRVLDIGCGFCETLGYHKARGCEVYGVEADENARKIAERYGFNVHIGLFDPAQHKPDYFDYVTMDHVLEHVVDPLKTLQEVHRVLKPGGKFIASVPNVCALGRYFFGCYWGSWHLPYHRHFYSQPSMKILAEKAGFAVLQMKSATKSYRLLEQWGYFFSAGKPGRKGLVSGLQFGRYFSENAKKQWYIKLYQFLKKIRFLSLSMRLADFFGAGDWCLIVLQKK